MTSFGPNSTIRPAYMTAMSSAISATTPRSCVMNTIDVSISALSRIISSRICACTVTPVALVTGDGRVLTTGPVAAIYPGPLLPNVQQQTITPEGIQTLVAKA